MTKAHNNSFRTNLEMQRNRRVPTEKIRARTAAAVAAAGRGRKDDREKVTLTGPVGAALCKSASQLSGDTHGQSGRAARGHERCHPISVSGGSAPEDGGLTRPARKRL